MRRIVRRFFKTKAVEQKDVLVSFREALFFVSGNQKIERALLRGDYDTTNFSVLDLLVKSGDTCLDIGANIGVYTCILGKLVGPTGKVFSFEPVSFLNQKLARNVTLNKFGKSVSVCSYALGDKEERLDMYQVKPGCFRAGTSSFDPSVHVQSVGEENFDRIETEVVTGDQYLLDKNIKGLDFIKIDVEGYEYNVLKGLRDSIKRWRPSILWECDTRRLQGHLPDIDNFFDEISYSHFVVVPHSDPNLLQQVKIEELEGHNNVVSLAL